MRILFVASECAPFAKAGGLGDVVGALPKALAKRGHDARVLIPRYGSIDIQGLERHAQPLAVPTGGAEAWCSVLEGRLPGSDVPIYFLDHERLFGGPEIYDMGGTRHSLARFGLLSRAAFGLCRYLGFQPDVLHAHDWPTALLPVFLNSMERKAPFSTTGSVLTIHNIAYQPRFPPEGLLDLGLPLELWRPDGIEDHGELNVLKAGLFAATTLTSVSPNYAREIRSEEGGAGLSWITRTRSDDLIGILNGVDEEVWDPSKDLFIEQRYDAERIAGKLQNKRALQAELGLQLDDKVPLVGIVSRLTHQKGIDVVVSAIDRLLDLGLQLAVIGSGDAVLERALVARSMRRDGRFCAWIGYSERFAHRIEAGADMFLMPSRFEPCGLNQMYSQVYGTLPIVRATGGLDDTVEQCDVESGRGTGFKMWDLNADALVGTVGWAVSVYRDYPTHFRRMQRAAMEKKQGWSVAAAAYEEVYKRAALRVLPSFD